MRKADITNEIIDKLGIFRKESADMLEVILNLIKEDLKKESSSTNKHRSGRGKSDESGLVSERSSVFLLLVG